MLKVYSKEGPKKLPFIGGKFILPLFLIIAGLLTMLFVAYPIVFFQLNYGLSSRSLVSPSPDILATNIVNFSGVDYTKASNWFPTAPNQDAQNINSISVSSYFFSIPKLGIKDAIVSTTSDDLFKNLIHYGASSLPGQPGNTVVFGHSTLPQLFNPKNYKTIFSTLHRLQIGDEIFLNLDGVVYKYSIFDISVISPQDISPLEQKYDSSYITIITCTPPGTYWKRLVIRGDLDKLGAT